SWAPLSVRSSACSRSTASRIRTIPSSTCIASSTHRRTAFSFASSPTTQNFMWRNARVSCTTSMRIMSQRLPMISRSRFLLVRCEERYTTFCSPCHGLQGDGNGTIAMRGMKRPPTYPQDRLRQAPNGYFYDNITNGFGAMYGYSAQIPPRDRWAIIAYVRALQLSRNAKVADLPTALRQKLGQAGFTKPGSEPKPETSTTKESTGGRN